MKRRKVQAQRKFAQGVVIPPSSQTTNVDKVTNAALQKDNETRSKIFHSSTSAKGLLDLISFQNLHKHREPIVLLERLRHFPEQLQASSSEASQQYNISQLKKVTTALKHNMCLRSKKNLAKFVKRLRNKNISIIKNKRQPKVTKDASGLESIDSCNEDDKPLMYLAKEEKSNKALSETLSSTIQGKEKKVTFDLGPHEYAASNVCEPQQKSGQRYGSPNLARLKDGPRRRSIVQTRSHGRTTVGTREFGQETPLGYGQQHRIQSISKTDIVKRQRLRTGSGRWSVVDGCESGHGELQENDEARSSSSPQKIVLDEAAKNDVQATQYISSCFVNDDTESGQIDTKNGELLCDSLQKNTDNHDKNENNPQKICTQPSTSSIKLTMTKARTPITEVSTTVKSPTSQCLPKKRPSNLTIESLEESALELNPIINIETPAHSSLLDPVDVAKFWSKSSQGSSIGEGQQSKSQNIDVKIKPTTSLDITFQLTENKTVSTSEAHAGLLQCYIKLPNAKQDLNAPLICRRTRYIPSDKGSTSSQDKIDITKKQISSTTETTESIDVSSKIINPRLHCPSKNYPSMNDVVYAEPKDLVSRCEQCDYCAFVEKVQCVSNMFKIQYCRKIMQSKIYGFGTRDEELVKIDSYGANKCHGNESSTECDKQTCYLTYDKDSDHVVEVKRTRYANQTTQIESADIVPKTLNTKIVTVTALDSDKLLDDIINFVISKKANTVVETPSDSAKETKSAAVQTYPDDLTVNVDQNASVKKTSVIHKPIVKPSQTDAPIFCPTEQEFTDPIAYFTKIMPFAAKFGICKVIAPKSFKPKCMLDDEVRFEVTNQYISRLYNRWGPASRELCAIKAYLASQSVIFSRPPLLEGVEVNLPKLYYLVQTLGGLKEVIEKKRWTKVAEEMNLIKTPKIEIKLDQIYVKYILPYDTMNDVERKDLMQAVDEYWSKKYRKMLQRAKKPLHRQKRLLEESESSEEEVEGDVYMSGALAEAEDCISNGRQMNLLTFKKVASKCMEMYVPNNNQNTPADIEKIYWNMVLLGQDHICVNNASIDTGEQGYGFTKDQRDSYGKHPWNLKVLSQNNANVLRFLGAVLGVTVPTLHLGMVFSTSCWHRDPHGLPWIEYMHTGPGKIWYGIPGGQSDNFRKAVELLCPTSCQNKSIWLPSDITMIPPDLLLQNNVSLSRAVQEPGQFILVFPKAYSCSIATGYTESESVYFATYSWLHTIDQVLQEVHESFEPTMFSLEHLLVSAARDARTCTAVLKPIQGVLVKIIKEELNNRRLLDAYKFQDQNTKQKKEIRKRPIGSWNVPGQDECEVCRATLYLSKVRGLTDKKRSVCLQHALMLLNTVKIKNRDLSCVEVELYFSDPELQRIMTKIINRV